MTKEALRLALEALEEYANVVVSVNDPNEWTPKVADAGEPARKAITAIKEALANDALERMAEGLQRDYDLLLAEYNDLKAQPEQEPVAFEYFKDWMVREMPPMTIIGNSEWWAKRIYERFIYIRPQAREPLLREIAALSANALDDYKLIQRLMAERQPLTHEQRLDVLIKFKEHETEWNAPSILIDLVEAAHGITGEKK